MMAKPIRALELHLSNDSVFNNTSKYILKQWRAFFAFSDWLLKLGISSAMPLTSEQDYYWHLVPRFSQLLRCENVLHFINT